MNARTYFLPFAAAVGLLAALAGCDESQRARAMEHNASTIGRREPGQSMEQAIFGAGCFWGVEARFRQVEGVVDTEVGYSGGHVEDPGYKRVCRGDTGHAEVVRVTYDPEIVAYDDLLEVFWASHDPTTPNRQGPDVGSQYRSAIFYLDDEQAATARRSKAAHQDEYGGRIVTEITEAGPFWRAEEYHQQYLEKRGGGACHF